MGDKGHPFWLGLVIIALFPIGATVEVVWAMFSWKIRRYIAKHPTAHFLFFACALLMLLLLIPAHSAPRHTNINGVLVPNPRFAVVPGRGIYFASEARWPARVTRPSAWVLKL
jgi:hypothetical protein